MFFPVGEFNTVFLIYAIMKTLYIVRHAKTNSNIDDIARQLLPLGIERTHMLGKYLVKNNCTVDIIHTSTALRAIQTCRILAEHLQVPAQNIIEEPDLYTGTSEHYIYTIVGQDNQINSSMIIGHNPQVSTLAQFFIPDFSHYMQTGACFCIDFETDKWEEIFTSTRVVRFYVRLT